MVDKNTFVSLDEHLISFVEAQVGQGRYGSASDVLRAGLQLLEDNETTLAALRESLIEGERSGVSPRTVIDILEAVKKEKLGERNG